MKFRKKPIIIEATQWFKMGDHPFVEQYPTTGMCVVCETDFKEHGWCPTLEGLHIVCPGDWIITGIKGEHYPCKADIFEATYEKVDIFTFDTKLITSSEVIR